MTEETSPAREVAVIVSTLASREMRKELEAFIPPSVDFKKFMQTAITAVQRAANVIARCDKQSVYNAIADAATKGLMPDGRQGALVPYSERVKVGPGRDDFRYVTKCQFLIMPEGIIEVAARNGASVYAVSVYDGDHVRLWNDAAGQHFEHDYNPFGNRGEMVGAVAVGKTRGGQVYVEAVNKDDIDRIKATSKQRDRETGAMRGPWADWEDRMWQKTALHRLHKRMPGIPVDEDPEYVGERTYFRLAPEQTPSAPRITAEPNPPEPARDVPRGTSPPQGRPRGLQRMVDSKTGEVYEPGDAGPTPERPSEPSPPAAAPPSPGPEPEPPRRGRPPKGDPF